MKNPKKNFAVFSSGASRIAGFGEGTPQQDLPKGKNRRYADFGTVVESCSKKLPLSLCAAALNTYKTIAGQKGGKSGGFLLHFPITTIRRGRFGWLS